MTLLTTRPREIFPSLSWLTESSSEMTEVLTGTRRRESHGKRTQALRSRPKCYRAPRLSSRRWLPQQNRARRTAVRLQLLVRYVFGGVYDIQSDKIILISTPQIANCLKGELDKAKDINYTLPSKESTIGPKMAK